VYAHTHAHTRAHAQVQTQAHTHTKTALVECAAPHNVVEMSSIVQGTLALLLVRKNAQCMNLVCL